MWRGADATRVTAADMRFVARREDHCRDFAAAWDAETAHAAATPFQGGRWVEAWYSTIGPSVGDPLRVAIHDAHTGALAALLPLVLRNIAGCRVVEFADGGVSDYNAPVLGPAGPDDTKGALLFWSALRAALPDVDFVRFKRMPLAIEGRANPLALLPATRASSANSNVVTVDGDWSDFLATLKGSLRRQVERNWRAFSAHDGAVFRRVTDHSEAAAVLGTLERQQSARLRRRGVSHVLDQPQVAAFYRKLVADGLADDTVVLTALTHREEVVAALLGIARGDGYVMLRISIGAPEWSSCSPGRLIILQTMKMLRGIGYRHFDFSIGEYEYKRRFGAASRPLVELTIALSPRGWPLLAFERAKLLVRRNRALYGLVHRLLASA